MARRFAALDLFRSFDTGATVVLSTDLKLRVCVASSGLGHVARGIESWAADLASALADRHLSVRLCKGAGTVEADYERVVPCLTRGSDRTQQILACVPTRLGWRLGLGSGYGVEQTTFAWNLIKLLRQEAVDILHVQDPFVAVLVQRARRLGWVKTRTILAHGTEEPFNFLRKFQYVQHLAPWHRAECAAAGVDAPQWTVIPNFIDTDRFSVGKSPQLRQRLGLPQDAIVVLVAAAIKRRHKRIDYLVREFAGLRIAHPQLEAWLVIAGGREAETDAVVAEAKQRLGDRVRFLIQTPRDAMPDLYRMADLFMLGSLNEMMPIAVIEAAASGVPCIVNDHPVLQWMTGAGGTSLDMTRNGELARTLSALCNDRCRRQRLGEAARAHAVALFGRDRVVDQILHYYRLVAGEAPSAQPSGTRADRRASQNDVA